MQILRNINDRSMLDFIFTELSSEEQQKLFAIIEIDCFGAVVILLHFPATPYNSAYRLNSLYLQQLH